ncbi:MAG: glycosyltransferase, partial [bacterium]|nr:glycosyltransferase [bacterium]
QRVEGLGIALLEAAARQKPLIGTACGGIREVVEDGFNGYLVGVTDVRLLAVRAAELLADGAKAQEMGVAAKARVQERFTTLGMAERTCRLLREAVESTGR